MDKIHLDIFKALSDSTRLEILLFLLDRKGCQVSEVCCEFQRLAQPTVSHHLQVLRRSKLIESEKKGKTVFYSIRRRHAKHCFEAYLKLFES